MSDADKCKTCNKRAAQGATLKQCSRCKSELYCSRDCQKADWKRHKAVYAKRVQSQAEIYASTTLLGPGAQPNTKNQSSASEQPRVLEVNVEKPFHKLHAKKWLHDRPVKDVYKLLIDTYRLPVKDEYVLKGDVSPDSIYGGATDGGRLGFRRFLRLVQRKRELLPEWWSPTHAEECLKFGTYDTEWHDLSCAVEKSDIIEHYGNPVMPMQLRMFGEQIFGRNPWGMSAEEILRYQMEAESGQSSVLTIDHSAMFRR